MYPQGYFRQHVSDQGWQEEVYTQLNFSETPVTPVMSSQRQPAKVTVELDSRAVSIAVWQVIVGRVKLYLLNTNLEENSPADRQLSARLYGGDGETRIQQEIVLGIGGVRVLRALGVEPSVWHANEGHAGFMMLERCRELVEDGVDFEEAASRVAATTVFTTHTPVPAGNDAFPNSLVEKYFHRYWSCLGLDRDAFLTLGTHELDRACFNMTVLGLTMARQRNGVSRLHGAVCRRMWHCLWPDCEEKEVPIDSVTNGIHVPTWVAPELARLYEKYLGPDWLAKHDEPSLWGSIDDVPDDEMWAARRRLKQKLIGSVRERARKRWNDGSAAQVLGMGALLDSEALTLGFSRRFTDYKRAALVLRDVNRLRSILQNELQPVQIVFSGKAHPHDQYGKRLIQEVYSMAKDPAFGGRIAFVEDYDMHMARYLVHGVDVWLNTPRPFQEACGTSGMKAALNGVPHLSSLDGWWYEAYNGANGWAIQIDIDGIGPDDQDKADADALYHLLEEKVIPLYYDRDTDGMPHGWIKLVKQVIRSNVPLFCARRMVKEYAEQMYLRAITAGVAAKGEAGKAGRHQDGSPGMLDAQSTPAPSV